MSQMFLIVIWSEVTTAPTASALMGPELAHFYSSMTCIPKECSYSFGQQMKEKKKRGKAVVCNLHCLSFLSVYVPVVAVDTL